MSNIRTNVALGGVAPLGLGAFTGALLQGGRNLGRSLGFVTPAHSSSAQTILGEIAQDVVATDDAGLAYPAGTWWVRTTMAETSGRGSNVDNGGSENTTYWIAVPSSLPGAFARNDKRNNRPLCSLNGIVQGWNPAVPVFSPDFYPSYTPTYPIRGASGIYVPKGSTADPVFGLTYPYGPCNMNGQVRYYDFGGTGMNFANSSVMPFTAGYRNFRMVFQVADAAYTSYWSTAAGISAVLTVNIFGNTYTVRTTDLAHNVWAAGWWSYVLDSGPSNHVLGDFSYGATFDRHMVNPGDPTITSNGGWRSDCYASPRIDIPLPWTVTDGANIIPGGYNPSSLVFP